jgi:radical SAM-linked protein
MRSERLVYLTRLGADKPRIAPAPAEAPVAPPPATVPLEGARKGEHEAAPPAKKKGPAPPPRIVQGEPRRTRFLYAKVGPMAYLSHLDLIRALPRSFRRIDVPLFYTSGFHPKPDMTFSPALSLGVASLAEILDVKLTVDVDPIALARELTKASPQGLVWKGATALGPADRGVSRAIDGARYAVGVPRRALDAVGGQARLAEEVRRVLETPEIRLVRRFERGLAKAIDAKRFLRALSPFDPRAAAFLDEARVAGDLVPLLVDVSITGEGGVKIAEIMEALFGKNDEGDVAVPYHAVRAELGLWQGDQIISPLELEPLRALTPPPSPQPATASPVEA